MRLFEPQVVNSHVIRKPLNMASILHQKFHFKTDTKDRDLPSLLKFNNQSFKINTFVTHSDKPFSEGRILPMNGGDLLLHCHSSAWS